MIFITKGHFTLGVNKLDKDGNIVESKPASFTPDDTGPCVAIGEIDPETMQIKEPVKELFGDWDAAHYLNKVMELLNPTRQINIPPLWQIVMDAMANGDTPICDYCTSNYCADCIIMEWMNEYKEDNHETD